MVVTFAGCSGFTSPMIQGLASKKLNGSNTLSSHLEMMMSQVQIPTHFNKHGSQQTKGILWDGVTLCT